MAYCNYSSSFNLPWAPTVTPLELRSPSCNHMSHYPTAMPSSVSSSSSSSSSSPSSLLSANDYHNFVSFLHTAADHGMDLDAEWQAFAHLAPQLPHSTPALAKATKDLISLNPAPRPKPVALLPAPPPLPPPRIARTSKRCRPTPPPSPPAPPPAPPPQPPRTVTVLKQTLLSPQQKKANHIQSEQKRRANIRRGYEALCDTVPVLREALRAEEEEQQQQQQQSGDGRRKRARTDSLEGERVDGRAGPRSESVVLQKTIDHIRSLRNEQSGLLARLERARSFLAPGHPALIPQTPPLWERSWDGGKGLMTDGPDEDE